MRFSFVSLLVVLVVPAVGWADDEEWNDKSEVTTTELMGSQSFSSKDTAAKAINDQDVVDMRDYNDRDHAAEALKSYQEKVSLVVGRQLDPKKSGSVRVKVEADGSLEYNAVVKHSGDSKYDKAMVRAVKALDKVPAPPEIIQAAVAEGLVLDFGEQE